MEEEIADTKKPLDDAEENAIDTQEKIDVIEEKIDATEKKIAATEKRITGVEEKIGVAEKRLSEASEPEKSRLEKMIILLQEEKNSQSQCNCVLLQLLLQLRHELMEKRAATHDPKRQRLESNDSPEATHDPKRQRLESNDSPEGTAFMKELLNSTLTKGGGGGGGDIMRFSVSPPWAFRSYKSLYIRKAYTDLHNIIWKEKANAVVVGNPGIGKSFFAVYELYRALKEGRTVVFQNVPTRRTFLFIPDAEVKEFVHPATPKVPKTGQTVLLYDAGTRIRQQYTNYCDKIIVFSSPCETNYGDVQKGGALALCMPTWSWEEIEDCAQSLQEYSTLDITCVRERFEMYGGIARFVLEVMDSIAEDHPAQLDQAISRCDTNALLDIIGGKDRDEQSHKVFHRTLVKNEDGSPNYKKHNFEFASKYVEKKAYKAMQEKSDFRLTEFLRSSRNKPIVASLRGGLFESKAHDLLMKGGKFQIRNLAGGEAEEVCIETRGELCFSVLDNLSADQGKYFLPKASNYVAVDAIAPPNAAYQMTVTTEHGTHASGLEKIVEFCNPKTPFRLYFVMPDDIFEVFKMQKYVTTHGKTAVRIPKSVQDVQQYALCIPLRQ